MGVVAAFLWVVHYREALKCVIHNLKAFGPSGGDFSGLNAKFQVKRRPTLSSEAYLTRRCAAEKGGGRHLTWHVASELLADVLAVFDEEHQGLTRKTDPTHLTHQPRCPETGSIRINQYKGGL